MDDEGKCVIMLWICYVDMCGSRNQPKVFSFYIYVSKSLRRANSSDGEIDFLFHSPFVIRNISYPLPIAMGGAFTFFSKKKISLI